MAFCLGLNVLKSNNNEYYGHHFADDVFKCIFLKGSINNLPALVLIMAWRQPGDKPSSGPMKVRLLTHICVTRPQRVNSSPIANAMKNSSGLWDLKIL